MELADAAWPAKLWLPSDWFALAGIETRGDPTRIRFQEPITPVWYRVIQYDARHDVYVCEREDR